MSSFFSYNLYLRDKSRSYFGHWTIFCKKCLHKQLILKQAERWGINIYVVWKTTIVPLSACRAFFSYNQYLRDKSRSLFWSQDIFCKKCSHKQFFSNTAERWGINIYVVLKDHYSPLWAFFSYVFASQITFFFTGRYFVKNAYISNSFLKLAERWRINIYIV